MASEAEDAVRRRTTTTDYRKKLLQHKELESRVRSGQIYANSKTLISFFLWHWSVLSRSDSIFLGFQVFSWWFHFSVIPYLVSEKREGKRKGNDKVEFFLVLFGLWFAFELGQMVVWGLLIEKSSHSCLFLLFLRNQTERLFFGSIRTDWPAVLRLGAI